MSPLNIQKVPPDPKARGMTRFRVVTRFWDPTPRGSSALQGVPCRAQLPHADPLLPGAAPHATLAWVHRTPSAVYPGTSLCSREQVRRARTQPPPEQALRNGSPGGNVRPPAHPGPLGTETTTGRGACPIGTVPQSPSPPVPSHHPFRGILASLTLERRRPPPRRAPPPPPRHPLLAPRRGPTPETVPRTGGPPSQSLHRCSVPRRGLNVSFGSVGAVCRRPCPLTRPLMVCAVFRPRSPGTWVVPERPRQKRRHGTDLR
jgi:hypothetical protein